MKAHQRFHPSPARYPTKMIFNVVLVAALGAAVYSVVSSQTETRRAEPANRVESAGQSAVRSDSWMPAASSTAPEGNVVDLTYPQQLN
jgi:hypothetical protein